MSGREAILNRLRVALREGKDDATREQAVQARIAAAPRGVVPMRGRLPDDDRVTLFCAMAQKVSATVERVGSSANVPGAVAAYLRQRNLPARVRMGADARLGAMPWNIEPSLEIDSGRAQDNPTTVNFLPEHHLVVVRAKDIVGDLETVFDQVRQTFGKGHMPRTLNFITGPSRSADIEQTLLLGAHGPRALHVIVVDGD